MITLTTPASINSILGADAPVLYGKFVASPFTMDAVAQTMTASLRLTSSAVPTMQPILGTVRISVPASELVIEVPQLDFYRRVVLSSGQNTAILAMIEAAQAQIENGLITLGVIAGVRAVGV